MDNSNLLCCPHCHGALRSGTCTQCQTRYEETLGILDLRWPRPKPMSQAERALLFKLIDNYHKVGFSELVAMRFQNSQLPADIQQEYEEYAQNPISRSQKMLDMFRKRFIELFSLPEFGVALDIGCGIGASSFLLASQFDQVVGIDVDLISLILARKFLEEQGVNNVVLAQAYAQKIPLPDESVHYAAAQNVVEHLFDVESAF